MPESYKTHGLEWSHLVCGRWDEFRGSIWSCDPAYEREIVAIRGQRTDIIAHPRSTNQRTTKIIKTRIPPRPPNRYGNPVFRTRPRAVICEPKAVVIMNGLLDIYDQPEDRATLDQAVVEEIRRGSMLESA